MGVRGRRQFHGRDVGGRLCEEDGVARQRLLLDGRVAVSAQANLLPATSAQGREHLGGQRCFADVQAFSANPIVVGTSVNGQLRLPGGDVDEAIPARPHDAVLVADSSAARPFVCRLSSAAGSTVRVWFHRNAFHVQQPPPLRMQRMLHAGCVQLVCWYERPARCVPLDVEERVDGLRRLQVVNAAVLEKELLFGVLVQRLSFVVSVFGSAR